MFRVVAGLIALTVCSSPATAQSSRLKLVQSAATTISRPSNPSTGFAWTASSLPDGVLLIEALGYRPPADPIPGRGGVQMWRVTGLKPGRATITLRYARSWETQGETKTEQIAVIVRPR